MKQLIAIFFLIGLGACSDDCENRGNCALDPDPGLCEAYMPRFYYDKEEGKCKEFIWGGCDGVVPFETLEACEGECNCN